MYSSFSVVYFAVHTAASLLQGGAEFSRLLSVTRRAAGSPAVFPQPPAAQEWPLLSNYPCHSVTLLCPHPNNIICVTMDRLMLLITGCPLVSTPPALSFTSPRCSNSILAPHPRCTSTVCICIILTANCSSGWLYAGRSRLLEVILIGETPDNGRALSPWFVPGAH